jgi:MoaA/NifB/PqqE/SkfB family radical SAM enzyme
MGLYDKIHWWVRSNRFPRDFAYWLLTRPAVTGNPLYQRAYYWRAKRRIEGMRRFPPVVALEVSAFCNANCLYCTREVMRRELGTMSDELYGRLIEQIKEYPETRLYLSGFGEPLMDKGLADKVAVAKQAGIRSVGFFSNLSLLTPERAEELVAAGLDNIDVSIDGGTPETYNRIRRHLNFETTIANLRYLASVKRAGRPLITVDTVVTPENEAEIPQLRRLLRGVADRVVFRRPESWAGQITLPAGMKTPHGGILPRYRPPCIHLWGQMNVYWDGTVPLCCRDFDAKGPLGDAADQTLAEIWQDDIIERYRVAHLAGKFHEVPLCGRCRYFSIWW